MKCKHCGKEIPEDANYCPYCTVKIENKEIQKCQNCGADLPEGAVYCPYCTVKVEEEQNALNNENSEQESTVSDTTEDTSNQNEETLSLNAAGEAAAEMPKPKSKKKLFIILAVSCLALILCVGGYFIYLNIQSPLKVISKKIEAAKNINEQDLVQLKSDKYMLSIDQSDLKSDVPGLYSVTYSITDSNGKTSKKTYKFQVKDTTPPIISIDDTITSFLNIEFNVLDYATVSDNAANLDMNKLAVNGKVDTAATGTYPITISIADASGNKSTKKIKVIVSNEENKLLNVKSEVVEAYKWIAKGINNELNLVNFKEISNYSIYTISVAESNFVPYVLGSYTVKYALTNKTTGKITYETYQFQVKDTSPPKIYADEYIMCNVNQNFNVLDHVTLSDNVDELVVKNVSVSGNVNTAIENTYPITLSITDSSGNKATKNINIIVKQMTNEDKFFEKIKGGYWHIDLYLVEFNLEQDKYKLDTGNYASDFNIARAYIEFIDLNEDITKATLLWHLKSAPSLGEGPSYTEDVNVIIDVGTPGDNKIYIDLGDGKGNREYEYFKNEEELIKYYLTRGN